MDVDWRWVAFFGAAAVVTTYWLLKKSKQDAEPIAKFHVGGITAETLLLYSGYDYFKPILVSVRGQIYDVTKSADQYAPGKPKHAHAGREIARALAKDSTDEKDLGSDVIHDLDQEAAERLQAAEAEFQSKYDLVGQLVPLKEVTLEELAQHDGKAVPGASLWLSIQGMVFDVSKGSMFYGPDGMYPFAGKECARALALMSTQESDCNDDVSDLGAAEKETLRDWTARFRSKYPVVGKIVK